MLLSVCLASVYGCICSCVVFFFCLMYVFFFFKQKTAYEMRISDWSSDVCSSDLIGVVEHETGVQALPLEVDHGAFDHGQALVVDDQRQTIQIGRASCRERVCQYV